MVLAKMAQRRFLAVLEKKEMVRSFSSYSKKRGEH